MTGSTYAPPARNPADQVNPVAVEAMAEEGIDLTGEQPKVLTPDAVQAADVVVTMGCGDECPYFPGKRYEDWVLDDPGGPAPRRRTTGPRRDPRPGSKRWSPSWLP